MSDLDVFLKKCLCVAETQAGGFSVFMEIEEASADAGNVSIGVGRMLERLKCDGMPDFDVFGENPSGTKDEAERCLKALRRAIKRTIKHLKDNGCQLSA